MVMCVEEFADLALNELTQGEVDQLVDIITRVKPRQLALLRKDYQNWKNTASPEKRTLRDEALKLQEDYFPEMLLKVAPFTGKPFFSQRMSGLDCCSFEIEKGVLRIIIEPKESMTLKHEPLY